MNAVTLRNFSLPLRIAAFEKDLFAGFSLVRFRPRNPTPPCFLLTVLCAPAPAVEPPKRRPPAAV